jgi:hypothetical protein
MCLGDDRGTTQVLVDPLGFDRDHRGYCPCHLPAAWASVGARTRISNCPFGHGAYFSLHAPPGRNFRAATCLGVRRRSVRTAVHPGASSCCTVDTAASRWVAATQYSILPTPVATTTETPPANVLIMPRLYHGRSGLVATTIPARLDQLRCGRFHTLVVVALSTAAGARS